MANFFPASLAGWKREFVVFRKTGTFSGNLPVFPEIRTNFPEIRTKWFCGNDSGLLVEILCLVAA